MDDSGVLQNTTLGPAECRRKTLGMLAAVFLYSWVCLISYWSDFKIALENNLLPSEPSVSSWQSWRNLASEIFNDIEKIVHPRFLRAELRLARLDTIHRQAITPPFEPCLRHYWEYSSLLRENITLQATVTIFLALMLTAVQVRLATDRLKQSQSFMTALYGFSVFAISGQPFALGIVAVQMACNLGEYLVGNRTETT